MRFIFLSLATIVAFFWPKYLYGWGAFLFANSAKFLGLELTHAGIVAISFQGTLTLFFLILAFSGKLSRDDLLKPGFITRTEILAGILAASVWLMLIISDYRAHAEVGYQASLDMLRGEVGLFYLAFRYSASLICAMYIRLAVGKVSTRLNFLSPGST